MGIWMNTMCVERSAAEPEFQAGRPRTGLDGGMHFTGAVAAGEALCEGIGTAGFEYASELIGGEW